jgi:hypothetical protein
MQKRKAIVNLEALRARYSSLLVPSERRNVKQIRIIPITTSRWRVF